MKRTGNDNPNYKGGFPAKCEQCKATVWVKPSRADRGRWFCSKACSASWQSRNMVGDAHWRYQGGPVERTCEACGERFGQRRAEFNRRPARFCSHECKGVGRRQQVEKECEVCGSRFSVRPSSTGRFCSKPCKRLSQIKQRTVSEIARKRINARVAALMGYSLKGKKAGCKWESLVGYTVHDLMKHLESLFLPGMSWENIGEWHIDHIRPRCSFSYADASDPEFRVCWGLENLQPLWKVDNLRKGSRYEASNPES
jgi:hypothetical protein